jgi:hypothetical protein
MKESENRISVESEQNNNRISELCLVGKRLDTKRGELVFIGWTKSGKPLVSEEMSDLDKNAMESLEAFEMSGLPTRKIYSPKVTPLEYSFTGPAVDFKDKGNKKAEDLITYGVVNENGENKKISLGERAVLSAIAASNNPWQNISSTKMGDVAIEASPMYTLIISSKDKKREKDDVAILFKPTLAGESNEATFKAFIRNTIGRLLVLDESQSSGSRKGYLRAAAQFAGEKSKSMNTLDMFLKLRKMGLIDFRDEWLDGMKQKGRNITAGGLKFARALGLVEFSDETLDRFKDPLPYYDVDALDIDTLIELAEKMYHIADRAIRGN